MVHDAVCVNGNIVSSTIIREMIMGGKMSEVYPYLGRNYSFRGQVAYGKKIGTRMGFPTVNLPAPDNKVLPPNGVYFSTIHVDGRRYNSISNIGLKPTVGSDSKTIETFILDFDDYIYGKEIIVEFEHFHREEVKFENQKDLHEQIARDCSQAREYHNKYKIDKR